MRRSETRTGSAHRWFRRVGLRPRPDPGGGERRARRARPGTEALEVRSLLSVAAAADPVAVWAASDPVSPATTLLVKFAPATSPATIQAELAAVGGRVVTSYPDGPSVVALAPWASRASAQAALQAAPGVSYAEADATIHSEAVGVTPNDPKFAQQWGLNLIEAPQAWSIDTGASSTIVAVLDTGIDLRNTDFTGRLWVNAAKSTRFKTVYGWNFLTNSGNVQDDDGHGTHVSGILAATGNNALGVAGVDWGAKIMPLKILDSQGNGSTDQAVAAVYFAVNNGARVINASWGGDVWSQAMSDALNYANAHNVVFVTAAGNESSNNDVTTTFPASFRAPNELVVAALDSSGHLADYSNFGATTVDVAAPGSNIVSTVPGGFASYSGTSMATPFVSGTVALLVDRFPGLTAAQLVSRVVATARPLPGLQGATVSGGVVDAYYALTGQTRKAGGATVATGMASLTSVENTLLSSDFAYAAAGGTPQGFVNYAYLALYGRPAEAASVTYYSGLLRSGMARTMVVSAMEAANEAYTTRVARWYTEQVGWNTTLAQAKATPGVAFWAQGLAIGQSVGTVEMALFGTDAYASGTGGTPASYVDALSRALLGRPADATVLNTYVGLLNNGTPRSEVVRQILALPEARTTAIARLYQDELGATASLAQLKNEPYIQGLAAGMSLF